MDPWHVQNILLHPRDKNGSLVLSEKPKPDSHCASIEEYVKKSLRNLALPDWMVEKFWQEWVGTSVQLQQENARKVRGM
ncbi:MAG: hypothetical protein KGJ09_09255 [Candidatus Omnitrophica bacterium]|nr:hypothetical protein [Candidatus Omnitrophota bacterium]